MYVIRYVITVEQQQECFEMTTRLQQLCIERRVEQLDYRNINLLTVVSKLSMALVMGLAAVIFTVMS